MAITTYAELQTAIGTFLNRDDLDANMPTFIALAEAQINRDVRHWRMVTRSEATISTRYMVLPTDWVETIRLDVNDRPLRLETYRNLSVDRKASEDTAGKPCGFAHIGNEIEVYPTPDATYTTELAYFKRIPALSDTDTSNWLLEYAPDVYLYGALLQSAPFLHEDERATTWGALYAAAVQKLNMDSETARFSGTGLRMRVR